jgi:ATP-dependent helicase/nuclease subunit B
MGHLKLHFWDWDRPILEKAVAELSRDWKGGELDLSAKIILVPTAETGRRLREALAIYVAKLEGAVVAPHVWHPESALTWQMDRTTLATSLQEQLAWTAVLEDIAMEDFGHLFSTAPTIERRVWATGVAETLSGLKRSLGAGGFSFAQLVEKLTGSEDAPRWLELAALEKMYLQALAKLGVQDTQEAKAERAVHPLLPEGVVELLVFAYADPPLLLRQWLQEVAGQIEVKVFVQAPEAYQAHFDELGAPLLKVWNENAVIPAITHDQLHLVTQPQDQARSAVEWLHHLATEQPSVALGICDTSLAPHLVGVLAGEEVRAYDPAGKVARQHPLLVMMRGWQRVAQARTWRTLTTFLRLDEVLRVVAPQHGFTQSGLLVLLDDFTAQRLPSTLEEALSLSATPLERDDREKLAKLQALLADFTMRLDQWKQPSATEPLRALLEWIYGACEFATDAEADRDYTKLLGETMRLAEECQRTCERLGGEHEALAWLQAVLNELEATPLSDTRGEVDLVLHGWLELLWEPATGLIVGGFNDESVPGVVAADPFLPDQIRESLGLSCQASRRARDAYLLAAIAAQRQRSGALHLLLGQMNDAGDVLRPSRLLFACEDTELTRRVRELFPHDTEAPTIAEPPRGEPGWKLRPWRLEGKPESVSPSLLASYLRCPLRCYLQNFLRLSPIDAAQREMTPADFGGLVHEVLAIFGRDESLRDAFSEKPIREFLEMTLDRLALERWGSRPLLSIAIQLDTARQRLAHFAAVQANLRSDGWKIMEVELDLKETGLLIAGIPFHGRVDRVDKNTKDGRIRVWDYKTRHKPTPPEKSHVSTAKAADLEDPQMLWKCFTSVDGKLRQWTDLQLPLYVWALRKRYPEATSLEAGYIHLPAAVTETGIEVWEKLDEDLTAQALECAEAAAQRMKEGVFWPPTENLRGDDFAELLLGDPSSSVMESPFWKGEAA